MKFATAADLVSKGFKVLGKRNYLHPGYPGIVFQLVETAKDCAAIGGSFQLFPNGNVKMAFGADVGYHLFRDGDAYPRERAIPVHEKVISSKGPKAATYQNAKRDIAVSAAAVEGLGTKWIDIFTGESLLLGFQTRVPRGLLFNTSGFNNAHMWQCSSKEEEEKPGSVFYINGPVSPTNSTYPAGTETLIWADGTNGSGVKSVRVGLRYAAGWKGEIHPSVLIDVRKFVEQGREKWLSTLKSDEEAAVRKVWNKALEIIPASPVPFAIPLRGFDKSGTLALSGSVLGFDGANGVFGYVSKNVVNNPSGSSGEAWIPASANFANISSNICEYGIFRGGEQPTMANPDSYGESNAVNYNAKLKVQHAALADLNFYRVPNIVVTDDEGNPIFGSATLFSALSPLTRPTSEKVEVKFTALMSGHEASRTFAFRANKLQAEATSEDDPLALSKLAEGGAETSANIAFQKLECRGLEPFSRILAEFGAEIFRLVEEGYEGDTVQGETVEDSGERGSYVFPVTGGTLGQMEAYELDLVKLGDTNGLASMNDVRNRAAGRSLAYVVGLNQAQGVSGLNWAEVDTDVTGKIKHVHALVQNPVRVTAPTKFYFTGDDGPQGDGYVATLEPGSAYTFLTKPTRLLKDGAEQTLTRYGRADFQGAFIAYEADQSKLPATIKVVGSMNGTTPSKYSAAISDPIKYMDKVKLAPRVRVGDITIDWNFDSFDGVK